MSKKELPLLISEAGLENHRDMALASMRRRRANGAHMIEHGKDGAERGKGGSEVGGTGRERRGDARQNVGYVSGGHTHGEEASEIRPGPSDLSSFKSENSVALSGNPEDSLDSASKSEGSQRAELTSIDSLYCPSRFGRWKSSCHDPDLVVAHRQKGIEIWFTRTSAVILCDDDRAVVVREGAFEAVTTTSQIGRELLHLSSVALPGASAVRAVESAFKICAKRNKLPQWQDVDRSQPISALAAIHQALNAFPEEVFFMTRDPREIDITDLAQSASSGSEDTVVSPEGLELDVAARRNSAYIHWRRPGQSLLRKQARLTEDTGESIVEEMLLPPIPVEELNRFIHAIDHAGDLLDAIAKDNGGKHRSPPEDPFTHHVAVTTLAARANRGDEGTIHQLLERLENSDSAGARALAVRALGLIARPDDSDNCRILSFLMVGVCLNILYVCICRFFVWNLVVCVVLSVPFW